MEIQHSTKPNLSPQKKMAIFFQVSERTVWRWKSPTRKMVDRLGRKPKIGDLILITLRSYFKVFPNATQRAAVDYLCRVKGLKVHQSTISRALKKLNITRKKMTYHYTEQLTRVDKINHFIETTKPLLSIPLLALDECSFHLNEAPKYGYSTKGSRANSHKPGNKGKNHTLILCIQNTDKGGMIYYELIEGGINAQIFHDFLTNLNLPADTKHQLLLDNVRVHHAKQACQKLGLPTIKELLESKNIEPIYLPPYTPELNPVELCFNFIRLSVKKYRPRTVRGLKFGIDLVINILNQKDLTQFFQHCWDNCSKKEESKPIVKKERHWSQRRIPWLNHPRVFPVKKWWKLEELDELPSIEKIMTEWKRLRDVFLKSGQIFSN